MQRWLFGLGFLFVVPAFAEDVCSPVDLREKLGPPMHQGDSGYCFAHSSSSLIQAKLGVRVSPMALAVNYLLATPEDFAGAADPRVRERLTPDFFAQWHKDRTQEMGNYTPEKILTPEGLLNTGGDELQTLLLANFTGFCDESRLPTGEEVYKKYLSEIVAFHAKRMTDGIPSEELSRSLGEITDPSARGMAWSYRHWVENRCGTYFAPRMPVLPTEVSLASNLKSFRRLQRMAAVLPLQAHVMDAVNAQLSRGNVVGIGYALSDIMSENKSVVAAGQPVPADVDHASVLAARRSQGGKCYYYLRNSFGTESEGYLPSFKGRIEQGGVWVLPEELPSLYSAVWLD